MSNYSECTYPSNISYKRPLFFLRSRLDIMLMAHVIQAKNFHQKQRLVTKGIRAMQGCLALLVKF